ncbi:MAG: Periplasmic thiol:disulfide interchange protein DsbA [Parcubacteria bacterium C7867-005]|nr:MAG: Periplasmic thiol:disulfide interchange protein DsbA [Parcubacteria bacterium C7867-005]
MDTNTKETNQMIPLSILAAGALIALSIFFSGSTGLPQNNKDGTPLATVSGKIEEVTDKDHILGSVDADVVIVEYSDFECPFCKVFHNTMHDIVRSYDEGRVAWVYRQFPIAQLHSKAAKEAEATECAASLGGNGAFWKMADLIFSTTNSNDSLDLSKLPAMAGSIGLDSNAFNECLTSGKFTKTIQDAVVAAGKAGAKGTPYSVAISKSGEKVAISGAQSFEKVKAIIDSLIK